MLKTKGPQSEVSTAVKRYTLPRFEQIWIQRLEPQSFIILLTAGEGIGRKFMKDQKDCYELLTSWAKTL